MNCYRTLVAMYGALERGRISLEVYYRQYAAVMKRYGYAVYKVGSVVECSWEEWLRDALDAEEASREIVL